LTSLLEQSSAAPQMADALRGSMDAAEYKHVVLGLIFLKYISDAFEEQHAKLVAEQAPGGQAEAATAKLSSGIGCPTA
jgi:type I restriction-modification system DNA methylase subunit